MRSAICLHRQAAGCRVSHRAGPWVDKWVVPRRQVFPACQASLPRVHLESRQVRVWMVSTIGAIVDHNPHCITKRRKTPLTRGFPFTGRPLWAYCFEKLCRPVNTAFFREKSCMRVPSKRISAELSKAEHSLAQLFLRCGVFQHNRPLLELP